MDATPIRAVLLDVDGTLVDTNYLHAIAWQRAFRAAAGLELPAARLHRAVGMGGDKYVAHVAGEEVESACGDAIRDAHTERYGELIDEARVLPGGRELIEALKRRDLTVVLASSGKAEELDRYLELLDASDLLDGWTTSADVEETKPAPELLEVALERAGRGPALLVGDSVWDCHAAARIDIPAIGLLSGGFAADELRDAGAAFVCDDAAELAVRLDEALAR
ncbi:HAD family hydrolase [Conexibacter arvalis]|uniref:HAD superfamily hydrolase (TIGR01509 family) n=1 Tax=Conexibacter arvalis TaxID=912552 RepID=A0A840IE57_9ACTN|nr:HAD family hydrolase [Conexibacter arvalis]MBB4662354.1 HAD superfamily hydrolase (TIGR01509 family) [Conexibacter arvalis]